MKDDESLSGAHSERKLLASPDHLSACPFSGKKEKRVANYARPVCQGERKREKEQRDAENERRGGRRNSKKLEEP